jgi:CO/xanthine dehydrogenase Mo-binding subunit
MTVPIKPLPPVDLPPLRQVGQPVRRVDALGKAVGTTQYAGDFTLPNMLHAKVLRSPHSSARIVRLDAAKARALPGVVCVLTAADLPGAELVTDMPGQTGQQKRAGSDAPVLAGDSVRYVGEPVALVAAETLALAEQALKLIDVEYEPVPGVYDPLLAMQPGAPILHQPDNIVARWKVRKGDVARGMARADVIAERTYRVPYQEHAYLETESGVAWVDERDVINIRVSTQVVEHFRSIAKALGVSQNKLRVQGAMVGGGFGGKEDITVEIYLGLLAQHTGRPVKMIWTREESLLAHSKRHPMIITHRTGVTRAGEITAAEIKIVADSGAYPYLSPYVLLYATVVAPGPYRVEDLSIDSVAVATNNPFTSAFRGFGAPQACFAHEQQMDVLADAIGMDRLEFRRRNYLRTGDRNTTGQVIRSAAWLEETATRALAALGEKTPEHGPIKVGQGFASYMQSYGRITWFHDTSQAWVGLELDGSVVIRAGVPDIGGGQISSLCQIAAEVLGVPMQRISVYSTDSATTPLAGTTTATRQLYMSGNAVLQASRAVRKTLLDRASYYFEVPPEGLDLAGGDVFVTADPEQRMPLAKLAGVCASEGLHLANLALFKGPFTDRMDAETGQGDVFPDFTFGTHAIEVAVDTETGEVTVLKSVGCHDVGRAINPIAVDGQIQGGSAQGLGYALTEDYIVRDGVTLTPSLSEYLVPTARDFPTTQAIMLESGTGVGPFGAKGVGEPSLTAVAPAVANAVADALGLRIFQIPITPERVLSALDEAAGATD